MRRIIRGRTDAGFSVVADARLRLGLTQFELGRDAGVSEQTVHRAEMGLSISARSARKLAAALHSELPELFEVETYDANPVKRMERVANG